MAKPRHEPSEATRTIVQVLYGAGLTKESVAKQIGICDKTLDVYYEEELEKAKTSLDLVAVSALFKNIRAGREASIIFYLKARMGWKETQVVDVQGLPPVIINVDYGDGTPVPFEGKTIEHEPNQSKLPPAAVREETGTPVPV